MVSVNRIELALKRSGDRFRKRIFTPEELDGDPEIRDLAAIFAAKEAFFKALGTGLTDGVRWHDFSLSSIDTCSVKPLITGRSLDLLYGRRVLASVSRTDFTAVAVVILGGDGE